MLRDYEKPNVVRFGAWSVLTLLATVIGLYSLRYGLPKVPNVFLPNFFERPKFLITHALTASIALLLGPWQFVDRLRLSLPIVHRVMGRVYVTAVAIAWISSIPVAVHAYTGAAASIGFLGLGIFWIATTTGAVRAILYGYVAVHKRLMIRSYALTCAAITLRIYLGLALGLEIPKALAYPAISYLCWIPNLIAVEVFFAVRHFRDSRLAGDTTSLATSESRKENTQTNV